MARTGFDRYVSPTKWDIGIGVVIFVGAAILFYVQVWG